MYTIAMIVRQSEFEAISCKMAMLCNCASSQCLGAEAATRSNCAQHLDALEEYGISPLPTSLARLVRQRSRAQGLSYAASF
jgi:hypothetical protein